jgi:hypothetical protein
MVASPLQQQNANQNMETPVVAKQSPQQGSSAIHSRDNQKNSTDDEGLWESAVKIFGPCVGDVDFSSFFQNSCQAPTAQAVNKVAEGNRILKMKLKKPSPRSKKRQGETLEFPKNGGFDDDVSAISAHTLEEMERLEMMTKSMGLSATVAAEAPSRTKRDAKKSIKNPVEGQQLAPPVKVRDLEWTYQVQQPVSDESISIGVSTSGSASSAEPEKSSPPRGEKKSKGVRLYTRAEI